MKSRNLIGNDRPASGCACPARRTAKDGRLLRFWAIAAATLYLVRQLRELPDALFLSLDQGGQRSA